MLLGSVSNTATPLSTDYILQNHVIGDGISKFGNNLKLGYVESLHLFFYYYYFFHLHIFGNLGLGKAKNNVT